MPPAQPQPQASANAVNNQLAGKYAPGTQPASGVQSAVPAAGKKQTAGRSKGTAAPPRAGGYVTVEYEGSGGAQDSLAAPLDSLGYVEEPDSDLAGLGRPPPAAGLGAPAAVRAPITNELLDPTLQSGTRGPPLRSPLSSAPGPPTTAAATTHPQSPPGGGRVPPALPQGPLKAGGGTGGSGAGTAVSSPDDWVVNITTTDFRGAAHIAKRQARHYHSLPGSITLECQERLLRIVRCAPI